MSLLASNGESVYLNSGIDKSKWLDFGGFQSDVRQISELKLPTGPVPDINNGKLIYIWFTFHRPQGTP